MTADVTPDIAWLFIGIALGIFAATAFWILWVNNDKD